MSKYPQPGTLYRLKSSCSLFSTSSVLSKPLLSVIPEGDIVVFVSIPNTTQKVSHSTNRNIDVVYRFIKVVYQDMIGYLPCQLDEQGYCDYTSRLMLFDENHNSLF